jgi:hypothetical protein
VSKVVNRANVLPLGPSLAAASSCVAHHPLSLGQHTSEDISSLLAFLVLDPCRKAILWRTARDCAPHFTMINNQGQKKDAAFCS